MGLGGVGQTTDPRQPWPAQPIAVHYPNPPKFCKGLADRPPSHPRGQAGLHKSWVGLGCSTAQLPKPPPLNHSRALSQVCLKDKHGHWLRVTGVVRAGTGVPKICFCVVGWVLVPRTGLPPSPGAENQGFLRSLGLRAASSKTPCLGTAPNRLGRVPYPARPCPPLAPDFAPGEAQKTCAIDGSGGGSGGG